MNSFNILKCDPHNFTEEDNNRKFFIDNLKEAVEKLKKLYFRDKNGKVLSKDDTYLNNNTTLEIETEDGFRFFRSLNELKKGRWVKFNKKIT